MLGPVYFRRLKCVGYVSVRHPKTGFLAVLHHSIGVVYPVWMLGLKQLPEQLFGCGFFALAQLSCQFLAKKLVVDLEAQVVGQVLGLPFEFLAAAAHLAFQLARRNEVDQHAPDIAFFEIVDRGWLLHCVPSSAFLSVYFSEERVFEQ